MGLFQRLCVILGFVLLVSACVSCARALENEDPISNFKLAFTNDGFQTLLQGFLDQAAAEIGTITVPDIHGYQEILIGNISYDLTQMTIHDLKIGDFTFSVGEKQAELIVSHNEGTLSCHWAYKDQAFPYAGDHGTADVTLIDLKIDMAVEFNTKDYHPHIKLDKTVVNIGSIDVDIHGGAAWLYNFLIKVFESKLKDVAEKAMEKSMSDALMNNVNEKLQKYFTKYVDIGTDGKCMMDNRVFGMKTHTVYDDVELAGGILIKSDPTLKPPYTPRVMPDVINNRMNQYLISDYHWNSYWWAYWKQHMLMDNGTTTTTQAKQAIPGLYAACPDCPMLVQVVADTAAPPTMQLDPGAMTLDMPLTINLYYRKVASDPWTPAISFAVDLQSIVYGGTSGHWVKISLEYYGSTYKVTKTSVGDVSQQAMPRASAMLASYGINPWIEKFYQVRALDLVLFGNVEVSDELWVYGDGFVAYTLNYKFVPGG